MTDLYDEILYGTDDTQGIVSLSVNRRGAATIWITAVFAQRQGKNRRKQSQN